MIRSHQKCIDCGEIKPISEFYKDPRRSTHGRVCKQCRHSKRKMAARKRGVKDKQQFYCDRYGSYPVDYHKNTRRCNSCGEIKDLSDFIKDNRFSNVYSPQCRPCWYGRDKIYRKRNHKVKPLRRLLCAVCGVEYYSMLPRKYCSKKCSRKSYLDQHGNDIYRKYYLGNRDKILAYAKKRYYKNIIAERARVRAWKHSNPDKVRINDSKRWDNIRKNSVGDIDKKFINQIVKSTRKCAYCGKIMAKGDKSIDHLVPVVHGGEHSRDNLIVCHLRCNINKGARRLSPISLNAIRARRNKLYVKKRIDVIRQYKLFN